MSVAKAGSGPVLNPQLAAALQKPLERLKNGEAGISAQEVAAFLDQFRGHSTDQLRLVRQMIIGADPQAFNAFDGTKGNPLRGAPTPERLVRLLSGEAHGLKQLPTNVAEATAQLGDASDALWMAERLARPAVERLGQLGTTPKSLTVGQQQDFEAVFALGRRKAERDSAATALQGLQHLRPGGAPVFSPRLFELMQQPLGEGRPTLGDLILSLHEGKPGLELRDVPVLLDRLLDLNPYELKQLRRSIAPTKAMDPQYEALGRQNPLKGMATPEKLVAMLSGVCYGHEPQPTTADEARASAEKLREQASKSTGQSRADLLAQAGALDAVAERLASIKRLTGSQQRSWMVSVSLRSGIKGVASTGYEKIVGQTAVDRQTGKRETQFTNQVFVRSAVTLNSYTWAKHIKGKAEYGITLPYVYGAVGNPLFGPRVGFHIPLVASGTLGANGTVGLGVVFPTPVPLVNVGVTAYVTDPRLMAMLDPAFDAIDRVKQAVQPITAPISDLLENLRHKVQEPANDPGPVELWSTAPKADDISAGEVVSVTGPLSLRLDGQRLELTLAPGAGPANVQLATTAQRQLTLTLDGRTQTLPSSGGKTRVVIGDEKLWVQLGEGPGAKGVALER